MLSQRVVKIRHANAFPRLVWRMSIGLVSIVMLPSAEKSVPRSLTQARSRGSAGSGVDGGLSRARNLLIDAA